MTSYWGVDLQLRSLLTSALDVWAALQSGGFTPGKRRRYWMDSFWHLRFQNQQSTDDKRYIYTYI